MVKYTDKFSSSLRFLVTIKTDVLPSIRIFFHIDPITSCMAILAYFVLLYFLRVVSQSFFALI